MITVSLLFAWIMTAFTITFLVSGIIVHIFGDKC